MKTQNSKVITTVIAMLTIGMILSSPMALIPNVSAQTQTNVDTSQSPNCLEQMLNNLPDLTASQQKVAIALAEKSVQFSRNTKNSGFTLVNVAPNYSFDPKTCSNVTINAVTVGFKLSNGSSLGIYEDGSISKVTGANV
ncbi:MAG: hypothetical protein KGI10_09870, partial [Thaumarchaeota archaeon]|nr:hypothetical protein [Nitrososphaerota archaeon]